MSDLPDRLATMRCKFCGWVGGYRDLIDWSPSTPSYPLCPACKMAARIVDAEGIDVSKGKSEAKARHHRLDAMLLDLREREAEEGQDRG